MHIAVLVIVFFLSVEAMFWAFSINRHAFWLKYHPDYDRRLAVPSHILRLAGAITAIFSLSLWIYLVYSFSLIPTYELAIVDYYFKAFFIGWGQLSLIHLWGLIARYSCLHTQFWPVCSGLVSNLLVKYFKLTDLSHHCHSLKKWNEMDRLSEKHRLLIFKFADEMRDLLWTKDEQKRFTYINQAIGKNILLLDIEDAIGSTHKEIADVIRDKNIPYSFDNVGESSDNEVLRKRKMLRFINRGIVADKEVILHVLKSPIFLNGEIIGIIGVARDISFEVSSLEKIELLFKAEKTNDGIELFYAYKEKFMDLSRYNGIREE